MPFSADLTTRRPAVRRRMGLATGASKLVGAPVTAVVPLQRHRPAVVQAASVAEIAALAIFIATGSLVAMLALLGISVVLIGVGATNTRRVLALTGKGNVLLAASVSGWPNGVVGPVHRDMVLPPPAALGVSVEIGDETWWIDRSSFRLLRRARLVQAAESDEQEDRQTPRP